MPRPPLPTPLRLLHSPSPRRKFSTTTLTPTQPTLRPSSLRSQNDFTHLIIGGGVVGLAVAARLAQIPGTETILLERHGRVGTETSSRNSEVIHAGIYYPKTSLKTRLCIDGAARLYELLPRIGVAHRKTGKWIVAQTPPQLAHLHKLHAHATTLGVPTRFLSHREAASREPLIRARAGVLESPGTGIMDAHGYMCYLESAIAEEGGVVAVNAPVVGVGVVDGDGEGDGGRGYAVSVAGGGGEVTTITADIVVNAAGLGAVDVHNLLVGQRYPGRKLTAYFAKGTYYTPTSGVGVGGPSPAGEGKGNGNRTINTLIYPVVPPHHGGLGTHLTLDLTGRVRFGPDVDWGVTSPTDLSPRVSAAKLAAAEDAVREYLPSLALGGGGGGGGWCRIIAG